ncbi:MAG: hypothetical protein NUV46_02775 [Nanoarchaeota archaeon]|nr:hypothetical protein [Nanoarchaeota archaeon]
MELEKINVHDYLMAGIAFFFPEESLVFGNYVDEEFCKYSDYEEESKLIIPSFFVEERIHGKGFMNIPPVEIPSFYGEWHSNYIDEKDIFGKMIPPSYDKAYIFG